jgi:hypothetical protein
MTCRGGNDKSDKIATAFNFHLCEHIKFCFILLCLVMYGILYSLNNNHAL